MGGRCRSKTLSRMHSNGTRLTHDGGATHNHVIVTLAPSRPPSPDELEALIREARARQRRRRLLAATSVGLVAAAILALYGIVPRGAHKAKSSHAQGPVAFASLPRCRSDQLRLSLVRGGVAAGTVGDAFGFTNTSLNACMLRGWPSFRLVMRNGRTVTPRPHDLRATAFSVRHPPRIPRIALRPGATAPWNVLAADGTGLNRMCPTARVLLVVPPGAHELLSLKTPLPYCGARFFWVLPIGRTL